MSLFPTRLYAHNCISSTHNSAWDMILMTYLLNDWILTYLFQLLSLVVSRSLEHTAAGGHIALLGELLKQWWHLRYEFESTLPSKYEHTQGKVDIKRLHHRRTESEQSVLERSLDWEQANSAILGKMLWACHLDSLNFNNFLIKIELDHMISKVSPSYNNLWIIRQKTFKSKISHSKPKIKSSFKNQFN